MSWCKIEKPVIREFDSSGPRVAVIIGAARSGTNILRNVLTEFEGVGTWPCDEINYIWKHGNVRFENDEFPASLASEGVKEYIRKEFLAIAQRTKSTWVVEKTCANSLRVPFVRTVLPEARFIHLIRDGRDAAFSAMERWKAVLDIRYVARKARYVPLMDMPYYASKYFMNRIYKVISGRKRLAIWGPRFAGFEKVLRNYPLELVCAIQWQRCVETARKDLEESLRGKYLELKYEDFVSDPARQLEHVISFLGITASRDRISEVASNVFSRSVGRWRQSENKELIQEVSECIGPTMEKLGYRL